MNEDFNANNELTNNELGNSINNIGVENVKDNLNKGKKKNKLLIIILIIGCIIILAFIVITILSKPKNNFQVENRIDIVSDDMIFKDISFLNIEDKKDVDMFNNYVFYNNKFYDLDGKVVFDASEYDYVDFDNDYNYILINKGREYGILDDKFNTIVALGDYSIDIESANCFVLRIFDKKNYSIFDVKNKVMYDNYSKVKYINDNFILVKKDDNKSETKNDEWEVLNFVDTSDDYKNKFNIYNLDSAENFNNEYIIISKVDQENEKYGVIDSKFNEFISFEYDDIDNVNDKYLLLEVGKQAKLITIDKKEVLNLNDVNVELAWAEEKSIEIKMANDLERNYYKTFAYYDLESKLLYEYSQMDETGYNVEYLNDNIYLFYDIRECFYLDSKENKKITNDLFCNEYNKRANKYIIKEETDGDTLYDLSFNPVFNNRYDEIILYDNFILVKIDNKYYIYSFDEKKILEESFDYYFEKDNSLILANEKQENEKYLKYYYFEYKK